LLSDRPLIVKSGLWLGSLGLATGLCRAVLQGRLLAAAIRGVPLDAVSIAAALSTLLIVTVVACGLPAWRASQTDPAVSLSPNHSPGLSAVTDRGGDHAVDVTPRATQRSGQPSPPVAPE
jgi:hypothetical protein